MGRAIAAGAVLVWLAALVAAAVPPQPEEGAATEEDRAAAAAADQPLLRHRPHTHGSHTHEHELDDRLDLLAHKLALLAGRCPQTEDSCAPAKKRPRLCRPLRGCERSPSPLDAPYQRPAVLPCACSCLGLQRQGGSPVSGVYWFTGMKVPVLCDFEHDDGGWTLLLTAVSNIDWDPYSVLARDQLSPTLTGDYSILKHADDIRDLGTGDRFAYRIETRAAPGDLGRQRWGGIWFAPKEYSFVDETAAQTDVALMRTFNDWNYGGNGPDKRMPWINTRGFAEMKPVLTTADPATAFWWGTMVSHVDDGFVHSPWYEHQNNEDASGTVLYWMRETAM